MGNGKNGKARMRNGKNGQWVNAPWDEWEMGRMGHGKNGKWEKWKD